MGFVDLHSHVLYGLDDGARDREAARAMLDGLADLGITEQCVTPHQKASQYLPAWDLIERTLADVETLRAAHHPTLRLGAENMWDDVFYRRAAEDTIPGYRGTNAFLSRSRRRLRPRTWRTSCSSFAWPASCRCSPTPSATTRCGTTTTTPARSLAIARS
jgi:hypothetical protein